MSDSRNSPTPPDDRTIPTHDSARPPARSRGAHNFLQRGSAANDAVLAAEAQSALLAEQLRTTQLTLTNTSNRLHAVEQAAAANRLPPQFPPEWIAALRDRDLLIQQLTDARNAQAATHSNERADMRAHINNLSAHITTLTTTQAADHAQLEAARAQHVIDRFTMRDFDENRGWLQAATEGARLANLRADACAAEVAALTTRLQTAELREANALLSVTDLRTLNTQLQDRLATTQAAGGQGYPASAFSAPSSRGTTPQPFSRNGSPHGAHSRGGSPYGARPRGGSAQGSLRNSITGSRAGSFSQLHLGSAEEFTQSGEDGAGFSEDRAPGPPGDGSEPDRPQWSPPPPNGGPPNKRLKD